MPFLRRGIAPRSSVPARKFRASRVPLYVNILFSIKSYTNEQLYAFILFCQAVNGIMAKTEAYRTVLILSAAFCLRAHGAGQNATFEHEMSTVLKMEMWRAHPCSRLIFAEYRGFITPVYGGGCAAALLVKAPRVSFF